MSWLLDDEPSSVTEAEAASGAGDFDVVPPPVELIRRMRRVLPHSLLSNLETSFVSDEGRIRLCLRQEIEVYGYQSRRWCTPRSCRSGCFRKRAGVRGRGRWAPRSRACGPATEAAGRRRASRRRGYERRPEKEAELVPSLERQWHCAASQSVSAFRAKYGISTAPGTRSCHGTLHREFGRQAASRVTVDEGNACLLLRAPRRCEKGRC